MIEALAMRYSPSDHCKMYIFPNTPDMNSAEAAYDGREYGLIEPQASGCSSLLLMRTKDRKINEVVVTL